MGIFKYISTESVVKFADRFPTSVKASILRSKYRDVLSKKYLQAMKSPKTEEDKALWNKAYDQFKRDSKRGNQAANSKLETQFIFNQSLRGYARNFADEYITRNHLSIPELEEALLPKQIQEKQKDIERHPKEKPIPEVEETKSNHQLRTPTREEIIKERMVSMEAFQEEISDFFRATYIDIERNRDRMEQTWVDALQNNPSAFDKIYHQELLKKVQLFKARKRIKQRNKNRGKERDSGIER